MKKIIVGVMLFAGLVSTSLFCFEGKENNDEQTVELSKANDREVRTGSEDEPIHML